MLDLVLFILEESEIAGAENHQLLTIIDNNTQLLASLVPSSIDTELAVSLNPPASLLRWAQLLFPASHTGEPRLGEGSRWKLLTAGASIRAQPVASRACAEQRNREPKLHPTDMTQVVEVALLGTTLLGQHRK